MCVTHYSSDIARESDLALELINGKLVKKLMIKTISFEQIVI